MELSRASITNYFLYDTCVENLFIAEYMPSANGDFVKVYLEGLYCAQMGISESREDMSRKLSMSVAMVDDAWCYWETQGIVRRIFTDRSDRSVYDIEFVSIREAAFGRSSGAGSAATKHVAVDDKTLSALYREVESVSGRLLESGEPAELVSLVTEYSIAPEVIVLCYKVCTEKGRSNRCKYVSTILKDWKAKGLSTVADVEEYLDDLNRHNDLYHKVFKTLGFHRSASEPEKRMMDRWFDEMGFSLERVQEACAKTTGITNPNLNYINSVLTGWYEEEHGTSEKTVKKQSEIVEQLYMQDREQNKKKTLEQRDRIFTEIPRIKDIMNELRDSGARISKLVLVGNRKGMEEERKKSNQLVEEKKSLLLAAGYAENAVDEIYTCRVCKDTGLLEDGSRCNCYASKLQMAKLQLKK